MHNFTIYFETSECTRQDSYQYSKSTIRLLAVQYKNDNTAFHRSSAVSGGLFVSGRLHG